jgi:hypothetical protein
MGMKASTAVLDGMLDIVKVSKRLVVCSCMPSSWVTGSSNHPYKIARSSALTTAAFTKADSSVGAAGYKGRKITVVQVANMVCTSSGSAKHVALFTTAAGGVRYITTCNIKALTTSDTVTSPSWAIHILQPTSST